MNFYLILGLGYVVAGLLITITYLLVKLARRLFLGYIERQVDKAINREHGE
jgi:hypothetical protein